MKVNPNRIYRSLLFTREQDRRMNRLLEAVDMNRNALVRLVAEKMTPDDVDMLRKR